MQRNIYYSPEMWSIWPREALWQKLEQESILFQAPAVLITELSTLSLKYPPQELQHRAADARPAGQLRAVSLGNRNKREKSNILWQSCCWSFAQPHTWWQQAVHQAVSRAGLAVLINPEPEHQSLHFCNRCNMKQQTAIQTARPKLLLIWSFTACTEYKWPGVYSWGSD